MILGPSILSDEWARKRGSPFLVVSPHVDDSFADLRDLRRNDRDVRVTVRGDEVTLTVRSPKKYLSIVVGRKELLESLVGDKD